MHYKDHSYSSALLEGLNQLRQENQLCDVVITVSDLSFPVHKNVLVASSPYFYAMFNGFFPEKDRKNVILQDIDPLAFNSLIDYIYTGSLIITSDNVQGLLTTACFLQIHGVQQLCCEVLEELLDASNCLGIMKFAENLACDKLCKKATKYVVKNFHQTSLNEEFLALTIEDIRDILSYDELYNHPEDVILSGIIRWVGASSSSDRLVNLPELLQHVHPSLINKDFLNTAGDMLTKNPQCSNWVCKVMDAENLVEWSIFILDKIGKSSCLFQYGLETKKFSKLCPLPEKAFAVSLVGQNNFLYVQGGDVDRKSISRCYYFNVYRNRWMTLKPLRFARSHHRSCILDGFLYAIGGTGIDGPMCSVERLELTTEDSFEIDGMLEDRTSMGATVYENCLYVMGGENGVNQCLYSMERFDPRTGSWMELAHMNQVNSYCSSAVVNNYIYCCEGLSNSMERYDIRANRWELIEFQEDRESYEIFTIQNELYSISGTGVYKFCLKQNDWTTVLQFDDIHDWDTAVSLKVEMS